MGEVTAQVLPDAEADEDVGHASEPGEDARDVLPAREFPRRDEVHVPDIAVLAHAAGAVRDHQVERLAQDVLDEIDVVTDEDERSGVAFPDAVP